MKKIFTLLFVCLLFCLETFAQCNPAIPSNAIVVSTSTSAGNSGSTPFWVCGGATLTLTNCCNDVYLEPGAAVNGTSCCQTVWAPPGSTVNLTGGCCATVTYVNAGDLTATGTGTPTLNQCPSMTYDYANAPSPGCALCTSAGTPATSINSSSGGAICQGKPTTLTQVGGTLGPNAQWKWYTGSCGGTLIDSGAAIVVSPASTTTYYLRAEDSCSTTCVQITLSPTGISIPVIAGDPTPLCAGQTTTLTIINNPCFGNCYYVWSSGDSGLSVVVNPASATTYTATVKNDCGDSTYSTITIPNCATGMALYSVTHGINISPNPSHGNFTISLSAALSEKPTIRIYDVIGNEIPYSSRESSSGPYRNEISIGNKPAGIYFVKMETGGKTFVSKLIIDSK